MPFRSLTADPVDLQKLADALDEAWIAINQPLPIEASASAAERERLSHIIMCTWQANPEADLAQIAIRAFQDGSAGTVRAKRQASSG